MPQSLPVVAHPVSTDWLSMLRRSLSCLVAVGSTAPRPKVERRKRRGQKAKNQSIAPGMPEVPKSAGGYVFQQLRPRLPIKWQYGWRWTSLKVVWLVGWISFIGYLAYMMFFKYSNEEIAVHAAKFTYVRNQQGEVVDIGYKPVVDSAKRAKRRADRYLSDDDDY